MTGTALTDTRPAERESFTDTLRRLSRAQKSGKGAPAYSRYINRKLGRVAAAAAYHLGLTPNVVTALSAGASGTAIAVLATCPPTWAIGALVTLLLVVGHALDAADGQLARLRGGGSVAGEWLDHMLDSIKIPSLHLAVLLSFYRSGLADDWLLLPIGFTIVGTVSFFAMILNQQLTHNRASGGSVKALSKPSLVVSLLKAPTDYGLLCLSFLLLGSGDAFLAVYAVMFAGSAGYLALALVKWFADMQAVDTELAR